MIMFDVLQLNYEKCSPGSWNSLLTSLLAENNRGAGAKFNKHSL